MVKNSYLSILFIFLCSCTTNYTYRLQNNFQDTCKITDYDTEIEFSYAKGSYIPVIEINTENDDNEEISLFLEFDTGHSINFLQKRD